MSPNLDLRLGDPPLGRPAIIRPGILVLEIGGAGRAERFRADAKAAFYARLAQELGCEGGRSTRI